MIRLWGLVCAGLLIFASSVGATTYYVPANYPTIQSAIMAASNFDSVLVSPGLYREQIDFLGKPIVLKSVLGPARTFLDPVGQGQSIVKFERGESRNAIIEGFTVRNSVNAPAISIVGSQPFIVGNVFINNQNIQHGGAIKSTSGFAQVVRNRFENNTSTTLGGGAIFCVVGDIFISENAFYNNTAPVHNGGAIHIFISTKSVVNHNLFYHNSCLSQGGGVLLSVCSNAQFYNNTLVDNSDIEPHGAGVAVWYSDNCRVYNNIVVSNTGIGVHSYPPPNSSFAYYNDVWTNTIDYDGIEPGDGSLSTDPMFVGGNPYSFRLRPDSPCIDAGDPGSPLDPDGSRADMGAYYYDAVGIDDNEPELPLDIALDQNYPNPFNTSTTIDFSLPISGYASIDVFDCSGRKINALVGGQFDAGYHRVTWNGTDDAGRTLASGVYFYQLRSDGMISSRRMLMIK